MQKAQQSSRLRKPAIAVIIVVVSAALVLLSEVSGWTHLFHHAKIVTASQYTKGEPATSSQSTGNNTSSANGTTPPANSSDKSSPNGSGVELQTPTGTFVSSHTVSTSSNISSACSSTPGATCIISFSNDNGSTISLAKEVTDPSGAAYWDSWSPKSIGLTSGTWHISAIASLSGQSKSATDSRDMVVMP